MPSFEHYYTLLILRLIIKIGKTIVDRVIINTFFIYVSISLLLLGMLASILQDRTTDPG